MYVITVKFFLNMEKKNLGVWKESEGRNSRSLIVALIKNYLRIVSTQTAQVKLLLSFINRTIKLTFA